MKSRKVEIFLWLRVVLDLRIEHQGWKLRLILALLL